jgi:AcrR family transcriptional regulator
VATAQRPLRADAARNRQRLIDAARAVFAERGLEATMDEVARRAEVGVGTAYRRFRNRDDLIGALFEERLQELLAILDEALADSDPWHGMTSFFERWLEIQAEDRGFRELLLQSTAARRRIRRFREQLRPLIAELLRRARDAGALRDDVDERDIPLISLMVSAVHDFAHDVEPELWRRALGLVFDGLRADRATATPLPIAALEPEQADRAMATWRPGRR